MAMTKWCKIFEEEPAIEPNERFFVCVIHRGDHGVEQPIQ